MRSLLDFPGVPPAGHINLCEVEGRIHSMAGDHAQVDAFTTAVSKHPHVTITRELLHRSASREGNRAVFIREPESTLKKLIRVWYEKGLIEALQKAAQDPEDGERPAPIVVRLLSAYILKLASGLSRISEMIVTKPKASGAQLVATVCQTRGWQLSPIRALAWHPHCTKIAVAAWDDSVRVYVSSSTLTPVLKYKKQRLVSCLAWRPMSGSELAVGCEAGVFVWQVDPMSHMARPSVGSAIILERPGHSPVTSIAWSPQGDILLTASAADTTMYAWDVATEQYEALKRVAGWGTCFVSWSPDGARVFSATTGIIFRVWDTNSWQPERWTVISGHVQTACWSPCGSVVLFATSEEALIYSLTFKFGLTQEEYALEVAVPVFDVSEVELDTGERIGGNVVSMVWDKKGQYLALLFKTTDIIAVFFTDLYTTLQVSPCCLINGMSREIPNVIAFQQNFEEGAVLTIGWSSGRVQHFPFIRGSYKEQVSIVNGPISPSLPLSADSTLDDSLWSPGYTSL